jgi:hypothetical protein
MKEVMYGAPIHQIGPAYFNQMTSKKHVDAPAMVGEQAGNSGQGGSTSQFRDTTQNMQPPVQQPIMSNQGGYNMPPSASKNATPYQGRVPSGVPQGYHYEYNTWNSAPNLGYQDGQNLVIQGVPNQPNGQHDAQIDQLMNQVSDMMQR